MPEREFIICTRIFPSLTSKLFLMTGGWGKKGAEGALLHDYHKKRCCTKEKWSQGWKERSWFVGTAWTRERTAARWFFGMAMKRFDPVGKSQFGECSIPIRVWCSQAVGHVFPSSPFVTVAPSSVFFAASRTHTNTRGGREEWRERQTDRERERDRERDRQTERGVGVGRGQDSKWTATDCQTESQNDKDMKELNQTFENIYDLDHFVYVHRSEVAY